MLTPSVQEGRALKYLGELKAEFSQQLLAKWQMAPGSSSPRAELFASPLPLLSLSLSKLRTSEVLQAPLSAAQESACPVPHAQQAQDPGWAVEVHCQGQSQGIWKHKLTGVGWGGGECCIGFENEGRGSQAKNVGASTSWKRQGMLSPLEPPERNVALPTSWF